MRRSTQLEDTAKKLPTLFPESIKGLKPEGDYSASPKIWEDKAGFDAKIESFAKVVTEAKAKIKDLDSLKATCLPSARNAAAATRRSASRTADHSESERKERGRAREASALFVEPS